MISTLFAIGKKTSGKTKLKQKVIKTDVEPELQTFDTYKDVGLDEEGLISLQNKLKNSVKQKEEDFGLPHRAKQDPKVIEAALSLSKNDIGVEDFRNLIFEKNQPKNWDFVPRPPGVQEIAAAVTGTAKGVSGPGDKVPKITRGIINVNKTIEEGAFVSSRLDIPAYNTYDVWAVTIHKARNAKKDKGSVLGFAQTAMLTDVTFVAPAQGGFMIATSQIPKNPIARMEGRWKNHTTEEAYEKAQELLTDKNWTQVGYNPFRVSYFYDRATMNPVVAADEVIQVGPFVIAKNVTTALPTDKRFEIKTKEGNRFNFEEGGKVSTNEQMDRLGFDNGGETSGPPKFEKRIARPDPEMFIKDPQSGNPQTHRMGWGDIEGQFIAYPTIIEQDGKLVQYGNNTETMKLMKKSGNFKSFDTKEEAEAYADGGWKTKEFNETYRKGFDNGGEANKKLERIRYINNLLKEKGYSKEARAGVLGNIGVETGYTYDHTQKQNNGNGYGLMQFDFQKPFYNTYLKNNNLEDSPESQINFTHEAIHWNDDVMGMNSDDRRALQKSLKGNDVNNATITFSEKYEKPGKPHLEDRLKTANEIYNIID